jgi:hypothetical protein
VLAEDETAKKAACVQQKLADRDLALEERRRELTKELDASLDVDEQRLGDINITTWFEEVTGKSALACFTKASLLHPPPFSFSTSPLPSPNAPAVSQSLSSSHASPMQAVPSLSTIISSKAPTLTNPESGKLAQPPSFPPSFESAPDVS